MTGFAIDYGTTADGLMAARVGKQACIALPTEGGFAIGLGTDSGTFSAWSKADVFGHFGKVADEAGFRVWVEDLALHLCEKEALKRTEMTIPIRTPWGMSQNATVYAEGIVFHSTAGHGGFKLDHDRNAGLPPALRVRGGWFEEDAEWAKVAIGYPALFTTRERDLADCHLRDWFPDAWESVHGRVLAPEESFTRDRERFEREHADDWVVIAASRSDRHPGQVETTASRGGDRNEGRRRHFLVPAGDYQVGRHGFVIDLAKHAEIATA